MKILFDGHAVRYPLTGVGRYTYELGKRLSSSPNIKETLYFYNNKLHLTLPTNNFHKKTKHAHLVQHVKNVIGQIPFALPTYFHITNAKQWHKLRSFDDYIFHAPNFYIPPYKGPCVTTIHDLSVFFWPQHHPKTRVRYLQKVIPAALKRSNIILTVSEFMRQEIATYFNWPLQKIIATHLAASPDYRPRTSLEVNPILAQWNLSFGKYSLFVGTLDPRKNISLLLDVYEKLPNNIKQRTPLIIAGFPGWENKKTLERIQAGKKAGWARYLGFVNDALLPILYAGARVFLYPSHYEGFGLPILEAMACGTPVICSNRASLPEVAGKDNVAALVDPNDIDTLQDSLIRVLEDDNWHTLLSELGIKRSRDFSWDKTASATTKAYKLALN